jgi:hypothetical protein
MLFLDTKLVGWKVKFLPDTCVALKNELMDPYIEDM